ncbi:hypothetical protein REPUB_Repub03eG0084400 [Reevesia pubescens]
MSKQDSRYSSVPYTHLPPNPNQQNVIILPVYYHRPNQNYRCLRHGLTFTGIILLLSAAVFFLYPSDPTLQLARLQLNHVGVNWSPKLTLDLSFSLIIRVLNRDFFSLEYDKLDVSVGYRGRELGVVSSEGGLVRARGSSYVNATLDLNAFEVVHDLIYLIADLAKGVIPFDTNTKIDGVLGIFFLKVPLQAKVSCEVYINTNNQTIVRQDCYAEAKWPKSDSSFQDAIKCPNLLFSVLRIKRQRLAAVWEAPPLGILKFNVDGSSKGNPGPAGISGLLHDDDGAVKMVFSKAIGVSRSNLSRAAGYQRGFPHFLCLKVGQYTWIMD